MATAETHDPATRDEYDTLAVTLKFDSPIGSLQRAEHAAEVFEKQLRREILEGREGPWGWMRARVESVVVAIGDPI